MIHDLPIAAAVGDALPYDEPPASCPPLHDALGALGALGAALMRERGCPAASQARLLPVAS